MHVVWGCWEGRLGSELPTSTARHSTDANAEAILGRGCRAWVWGCAASGAGMGKWGWELGLEPGKQSPWLLSLKGEAGPKCHLGGGDGAQGLVLHMSVMWLAGTTMAYVWQGEPRGGWAPWV